MTTAHANCLHESTKADRAACRKATADLMVRAQTLISVLDADNITSADWVGYAASRFADVDLRTTDRLDQALAVLAYFAPTGDDDRDARRRANGYTITTDPRTIRSIILRAAS